MHVNSHTSIYKSKHFPGFIRTPLKGGYRGKREFIPHQQILDPPILSSITCYSEQSVILLGFGDDTFICYTTLNTKLMALNNKRNISFAAIKSTRPVQSCLWCALRNSSAAHNTASYMSRILNYQTHKNRLIDFVDSRSYIRPIYQATNARHVDSVSCDYKSKQ